MRTSLLPQQTKRGFDSGKYFSSQDSIVALSSGRGGAIAVIRTSGEGTLKMSQNLLPDLNLSKSETKKTYKTRIQTRAGVWIDEAILIKFENPKSYTGEDVLEFHVHASPYIIHTLVHELIACGHRHALPGEFSFRAVKNGKIKLSQAEAVLDLIHAQNQSAVELALEKLSGSQLKVIQEISENLKNLAVNAEVSIDFSDQGLEELSLETLKKQLKTEMEKLKKLEASFERGSSIQEGVRVSLLGLPNVGKSSLFNALLGEDRSIVSEIAGTTRDLVREKITLSNGALSATFYFEDTAGVREVTHDVIEKKGIDLTWKSIQNAACVLFLVDPTTAQLSEIKKMVQTILEKKEVNPIIVFTKTDLWKKNSIENEILKFLNSHSLKNTVYCSSETGEGLQDLIHVLLTQTSSYFMKDPGELLITKAEHFFAIKNALQQFERALLSNENDLFSSDIREGLLELAPLIGETLPEDILGQIFSQFCIGK